MCLRGRMTSEAVLDQMVSKGCGEWMLCFMLKLAFLEEHIEYVNV